jgi:hypothetical protein
MQMLAVANAPMGGGVLDVHLRFWHIPFHEFAASDRF